MKNNSNDKLSGFWSVVSNALPPVGFFLYFKHRNRYPGKAKRALISALIGLPIAILVGHVMNTCVLS